MPKSPLLTYAPAIFIGPNNRSAWIDDVTIVDRSRISYVYWDADLGPQLAARATWELRSLRSYRGIKTRAIREAEINAKAALCDRSASDCSEVRTATSHTLHEEHSSPVIVRPPNGPSRVRFQIGIRNWHIVERQDRHNYPSARIEQKWRGDAKSATCRSIWTDSAGGSSDADRPQFNRAARLFVHYHTFDGPLLDSLDFPVTVSEKQEAKVGPFAISVWVKTTVTVNKRGIVRCVMKLFNNLTGWDRRAIVTIYDTWGRAIERVDRPGQYSSSHSVQGSEGVKSRDPSSWTFKIKPQSIGRIGIVHYPA